jgi:hypothetical protein
VPEYEAYLKRIAGDQWEQKTIKPIDPPEPNGRAYSHILTPIQIINRRKFLHEIFEDAEFTNFTVTSVDPLIFRVRYQDSYTIECEVDKELRIIRTLRFITDEPDTFSKVTYLESTKVTPNLLEFDFRNVVTREVGESEFSANVALAPSVGISTADFRLTKFGLDEPDFQRTQPISFNYIAWIVAGVALLLALIAVIYHLVSSRSVREA